MRVSSETLYYFDILKEIYSDGKEDLEITRSQILTRAFEDTRGITNWEPIINDAETISLKNMEYYSGNGMKIKAKVSDQVDNGIRELKYVFPSFTATRSVTLGVTVKYLLKGAIILNKSGQLEMEKNQFLEEQIVELEKKLKDLVAVINHDTLSNLMLDFKNKINY